MFSQPPMFTIHAAATHSGECRGICLGGGHFGPRVVTPRDSVTRHTPDTAARGRASKGAAVRTPSLATSQVQPATCLTDLPATSHRGSYRGF